MHIILRRGRARELTNSHLSGNAASNRNCGPMTSYMRIRSVDLSYLGGNASEIEIVSTRYRC